MSSGSTNGGPSRQRFLWFLALVITVGIVAFVFIRLRPAPQPIAPSVERSRNALDLRDGRLFNGNTPFTGIVLEHYGDGKIKSRSVVSNGWLEGLSEGWHTNGVIQVTESFVHGVSHGVRTKYYANGSRLSVAHIVSGTIEGLYQRWHENGTLAEQMHLTNGVAHGESLAFHPDGSLKARVRLDHGNVVEQKFWAPGEASMPTPQ